MAGKKSDVVDILKDIESSLGNSKKPKLTLWTERSQGDIMTYGVSGVDNASNCAGHVRGGVIEVYGAESCGKSWLALQVMAAYQKAGELAALIDVEHSFWGPWAAQQGVDISKLIYGQDFTCGEQAMNYAKALCETGKFGIVVIDSIAALMPRSEVEANLDDPARVGAHAAMMSRCLRAVQDAASKTKTTLLCINQVRNKIGGYGNPEETPGGKALKFYAAQRIELRRVNVEKSKVDGKDVAIGVRTKVTFIKNKVGQPFGTDEFMIFFSPDSNTPVLQLVNIALKLRVISTRKASEEDEDIKTYHWKVGDDMEDTKCSSAADLAEWFVANDLVLEVLDLVEAKNKEAKEKGKDVEIPEEVLMLRSNLKQVPAEDNAEKTEK
jgi:recombination protein RecA